MTQGKTNGDPRLSRRSLAKALAFGAAATTLPQSLLGTERKTAVTAGGISDPREPWSDLLPGVWRFRGGSPESFTPVTSRIIQPAIARMHLLPTPEVAPIEVPRVTVDRRGTTVQLPLAAEESIFGLGLQMLSFNQRGKKKTLRVNADPRFDTGDSHAPVPFYVSSRGYGIFVDTARYATFCFGTAHQAGEKITEQTAGFADEAPKLRQKDRSHVMIQIDGVHGIDVYLFAGPAMLDAVQRFNLFSGGGVNPPEWGLGFWYRTQARASDEEVIRLAREFRERKIPCDVLGLEPGWQTHAYSCSFLWGAGFPNPKKFVEEVGSMDYKVNLWEHAFIHRSAPFHEAIAPHSADYLVWEGLVPDFQDQTARQIFGDHHRTTFLDIGISGFKLDECDNSDYTGGWSFPEFSQFSSGQDGEQMHSVFGLRYQQTLLEQFEAKKMQTFGLVRSSGALAAPYPFALYSDLYDHRSFVRSLVNSGFSGLLWCPEVRDAKGPEDLVRRLQTAVFSPLAMINGWYIANPPWKQQDRKKNNANELSPQWEQLEARCREILGWRMMLIPYLRGAFSRYAADGTPPFRALILDGAADAAFAKCDDQFIVGESMMVAPLFDGEPSRQVVIPEGQWHDFWTGAPLAGGQIIEVSASYPFIPVYIKSGSVIPIGGIGNSTCEPETRRLTVRIFGDGSRPFSIGSSDQPDLLLQWRNGAGHVEQKAGPRPYTISAWIPATQKWS